jgi:hypothetical protein
MRSVHQLQAGRSQGTASSFTKQEDSMETTLIAGSDTSGKLTRAELAIVPSPQSTATHQVIPHVEIVNALEEQLGFRHIAITSVRRQLRFPANDN